MMLLFFFLWKAPCSYCQCLETCCSTNNWLSQRPLKGDCLSNHPFETSPRVLSIQSGFQLFANGVLMVPPGVERYQLWWYYHLGQISQPPEFNIKPQNGQIRARSILNNKILSIQTIELWYLKLECWIVSNWKSPSQKKVFVHAHFPSGLCHLSSISEVKSWKTTLRTFLHCKSRKIKWGHADFNHFPILWLDLFLVGFIVISSSQPMFPTSQGGSAIGDQAWPSICGSQKKRRHLQRFSDWCFFTVWNISLSIF